MPTNEWKNKPWSELAKGNYIAKDNDFDYKNSNLFFKMGYYLVPYSQLNAKSNSTEEDYNALKAATDNARKHEKDILKDIREGNNRQMQNAPTNQQELGGNSSGRSM